MFLCVYREYISSDKGISVSLMWIFDESARMSFSYIKLGRFSDPYVYLMIIWIVRPASTRHSQLFATLRPRRYILSLALNNLSSTTTCLLQITELTYTIKLLKLLLLFMLY